MVDVFGRFFEGVNAERLVVGYTDATGCLLAVDVLASGGIESVSAEPRQIFASALCLDARGIILAHNHPSGDPSPSNADALATKRVKTLAEHLGMDLVDHLIFGKSGIFSFRKGDLV